MPTLSVPKNSIGLPYKRFLYKQSFPGNFWLQFWVGFANLKFRGRGPYGVGNGTFWKTVGEFLQALHADYSFLSTRLPEISKILDRSCGCGIEPQSWRRGCRRGSGMVPFERTLVSSYGSSVLVHAEIWNVPEGDAFEFDHGLVMCHDGTLPLPTPGYTIGWLLSIPRTSL